MYPVMVFALGLMALPLAELVLFAIVASIFGFSGAVLLMALVSVAGILVLRHVGLVALARLRAATGRGPPVNLRGSGPALACGGVLLTIPGFVSGILGLMVIFPAPRHWLMGSVRRLMSGGGGRRKSEPHVIDLAPQEWRRLPPPDRVDSIR